jgi:hypothetical protein
MKKQKFSQKQLIEMWSKIVDNSLEKEQLNEIACFGNYSRYDGDCACRL